MRKIAFVTTLILVAIQPISVAHAVQKKAPCRLEVDSAHLSKNILVKESKSAVKVVFRSICNLDQANVLMTVALMKVGRFTDHPVTGVITRKFPYIAANKEIQIQDVFFYCKNTKRTFYYGVASSRAFINGITVYAPLAESRIKKPLRCGT